MNRNLSVKIGIFRVGLDIKNSKTQHRLRIWITMEGETIRAWKRRRRAKHRKFGKRK